jgi:PAS domain-containing protein
VGECNNVNNVNSGISEKSINNQEVHNDTLLDIIEKTRTIINSIHDGIIIYDKDFRYREWNPFMEKLS